MTETRTFLPPSTVRGFTLIELLVVMSIIGILMATLLGVAGPVQDRGRRSRATAEIQAMETALESYKIDNGAYPTTSSAITTLTFPNPVSPPVDAKDPSYLIAAALLYQSLSGVIYPATSASNKTYMEFKPNQVLLDASNGNCAADPWKNPYGYSYAQSTNSADSFYDSPSSPTQSFNTNFPDLWSTAGVTKNKLTPNPKFVSNWTH